MSWSGYVHIATLSDNKLKASCSRHIVKTTRYALFGFDVASPIKGSGTGSERPRTKGLINIVIYEELGVRSQSWLVLKT